jgi:hypothetical protein
MKIHHRQLFATIRTEGALLPADLLQRIAANDRDVEGLDPSDYHLTGERLNEAVSRSWNRILGVWTAFQSARSKLPDSDPGTTLTRERWLLPLFQELGYGRLLPAKSLEIEGKTYPVSHGWQHTPIHLVSFKVDLDRRTAGVAGAARSSPHSLVQEVLNRSGGHLWAFVSNGFQFRILRDSVSLTRQAFLEFDLEAMMDGEVYSDFVLFWLLCHESRIEAEKTEECWLERWSRKAQEQGTRALDQLRSGVEGAITALGRGFLMHPANGPLRDRLRSGDLDKQDYYRQILRMVYRLIFLLVAEDRELLFDPEADPRARERYLRFYSVGRVRRLAEKRRGTRHGDLYHGLRLIMEKLGMDDGCPDLALPSLGSFLFSPEATETLQSLEIANRDLLDAVRSLCVLTYDGTRRPVDFRNLGSEELGSVYESLLELHPDLNVDAGVFELRTAGGHERKTTGSYYTPTSLVQCLLDSALEPVLADAMKAPDPERAILDLKVCDPAAGSGHFLIAAAHRMARRLAAVRTGDEEPSPEATRTALRDVIGHCIYGVDINPMAVELCKVSLWMEALEPGKPLSFLDHHIQCGNSLLGTTPRLIQEGIPDDAFKSIEGDDRAITQALRRRNREQRAGQTMGQAFAASVERQRTLANQVASIDALDDRTPEGIRSKRTQYDGLTASADYRGVKLLADAWCAAFVWKKAKDTLLPVVQDVFLRLARDPESVPAETLREIERLTRRYKFLHWHVAFPDVFQIPEKDRDPDSKEAGWSGGFDVVLGNPPWERIKLQEKEWFAERRPDIANARNAADRRRLIQGLRTEDPNLLEAFLEDRRQAEGESHLVRNSGRYPLCGRGDVNTYAVFAETKRSILSPRGRVGCVVPSGIATDDTTKFFFQDLVEKQSLVSLYDFENREKIFPAVDSRMKFCLLTLTGSDRPAKQGAEFVFFALRTEHLRDEERRFTLSAEDIALLNPNTKTCPIFRSRRDAEITKAIYRRVPVLIKEGPPEENPWSISFLRMFDMANDSHLFRTRDQLEADGWVLEGNVFVRDGEKYLPLYEAKMIHQFDHRWATYEGLQTRDVSAEAKRQPMLVVLPRYWVPEGEVSLATGRVTARNWLLGWRDVCRSTDERTMIAGAVPYMAVGDKFLLLFPNQDTVSICCLYANLNSYTFDYVARQKLGGTALKYFLVRQLPVLNPNTIAGSVISGTSYGDFRPVDHSAPDEVVDHTAENNRPFLTGLIDHGMSPQVGVISFSGYAQDRVGIPISSWFVRCVLELTYTAWDLQQFALDCGYDGPPFRWDEERRFLIRCELDAAYFHLYGIDRDDVDYIMETFPIVKRKDEQKHGEYRTKRVILEIYDAMAEAVRTGQPYRTLLDPPPAGPRVAHDPLTG